MEEPRVEWIAAEKRQSIEWLETLEQDRLTVLDDLPLQHLAHLVKGLRAIEANRARLQ